MQGAQQEAKHERASTENNNKELSEKAAENTADFPLKFN